MDGDLYGRALYLVLLLAAVGGWVIVEYRARLGTALRTAAAWGLIFLGVIAGYGMWNDIRRDVSPPRMMASESTVELRRAADGHFYADLMLDGTPVLFMVDTGATNMVLSRRDAQRLGLDPDGLAYLGSAQTANGTVRTARVGLDEVVLGPFLDTGLAAYVNDGEMEGSLLGMDYLRRFSIRIESDRMILSR
ncbi:retropepsin-like aspartic protease family protein [Pseudogemmobacter sonorensis]|uniref:retropepsin-like aspartic protease family protein n=1 Tax=Pseudogemmobacter sonorensis TaxID=2989681 RepID=UPI003673A833